MSPGGPGLNYFVPSGSPPETDIPPISLGPPELPLVFVQFVLGDVHSEVEVQRVEQLIQLRK